METISQEKQSKPRSRREETVKFRITAHERRAIEALAAKGGYASMSDFLRSIVRRSINLESSGTMN